MRPIFLFGALLISFACLGQSHKIQFRNYPVAEHYQGRQVAPRLVPGTAAWLFRTRIREAAQGKPNFAGHYVLATWGCGAECLSTAIIDVKTGAVYFDDVTICCWGTGVADGFAPIDFRLNSQLIIFTGLLAETGSNGPHYFKFTDGRLTKLH